jgi:hypothetical protein
MRNAKMKEENQRFNTELDMATMASMISPPRKSDEKKVVSI